MCIRDSIMWMGELITQRGIGNGMSLIIFVSIVSRVPSAIFSSDVYKRQRHHRGMA